MDKKWHNFHHDPEGKFVLCLYMPRWLALDLAERLVGQAKWEKDEKIEVMLIGKLSDHP